MSTPSQRLCTLLVVCTMAWPVAAAEESKEPPTGVPENSIAHNFPKNGDADGRRAALAERGITYGVNYMGEVFGSISGGIREGARYSGILETVLDADFEKLNGWRGLTFHTSAFQIHGRGITPDHVGSLNAISNIEATPATRLFEFWFEQDLVKDKLSLRMGQMRVDYDGEFLNSQTAGLFVNANFGWPASAALNLPSGGATFPLAGLGARLKYKPTDTWTLLAAIFNDDPAGPCAGDPQVCNNDGLKFRLHDNPFVIGEVQYKYSENKDPGTLKGQIKFGAFADLAEFDDQRFGTDGRSLADPLSNGTARHHQGNYSVYGVIDQQIWRPAGKGAGSDDGLFAFGRIAGLPSAQNLVDVTVDAGLRLTGVVPGRPSDELGVGVAYNRMSKEVAGLDRDTIFFTTTTTPVHSGEVVAELTYKAQVARGWTIQPDLQYIWQPGGRAVDPNDPTKAIDNSLVLGVRSAINY